MDIGRARIESIGWDFEVKAIVELRGSDQPMSQKQRLAFRGLDFPHATSRKGLALREHLDKVIKGVDFFAIKKYGKDALLRIRTEFFYLPGEDDLETIVAEGRSLNQELLELGLGNPYDYKKREVDFSQKEIKVKDELINLSTGNFKAEVCMYINDCKQYLRSAIEGVPVDMEKGEFDPTDSEFLIIYGLKELKEECMRLAGRSGLDWKGN